MKQGSGPPSVISHASNQSTTNRLEYLSNSINHDLGLIELDPTIRELKLRHQTQLSLQAIAQQLNPLLRGWIEYYGRYAPSALYPLLRHVNQTLVAWAMRKFKRFKDHKVRASQFLQRLAKEQRSLFVHWDIGMTGVFA